jgi:molybdopterin-containing oxidoreductase family iron-sulfur binding subunit
MSGNPKSEIRNPKSDTEHLAVRPSTARFEGATSDFGFRISDFPQDTGKLYWRGLEELCATKEFRDYLAREFPEQASTWTDPVTRRQFLMLMGASLALAGISGCSPRPAPAERIMPYVRQPEGMEQGKPLTFATAMTLAGASIGLLVRSYEGRPTKIEGNPHHPGSLGATDVFAQASLLGLYDPDRSKTTTYRGHPRAWSAFEEQFQSAIAAQRKRRGAGLRILTEAVGSPTLGAQLETLLADKDLAEAKWYQFEPAVSDAPLDGARQAFGEPVNAIYDFKQADVIVALDSDFLACGPAHLRYVRDFADRRRVRVAQSAPDKVSLNRLYVIEPTLTTTGAAADHRLPVQAGRITDFARALATALGVKGTPPARDLSGDESKWIAAIATDLHGHKGRCLVLTGDGQPASMHALVHAINHTLENFGKTVTFTKPITARPVNYSTQIKELAADLDSGGVDLLVMLGGNPAYSAPADLDFARRLQNLPRRALRVHLGQHQDETAILCDWHIPEAHYLESWSDGRAFDGTASIVQPLIAPLYSGRTAHELLALFTESSVLPALETVRDYWRKQHKGDFEAFWRQSLQTGVVPDTRLPTRNVTLREDWHSEQGAEQSRRGMEIIFRPDPALYDGRFANNGWLQELPRPVTRLTWDNAALVSPQTARDKLGIDPITFGSHGGERGEAHVSMIDLDYRGQRLRLPAWIMPGQADDCITVHLGHGRSRAGHVGSNVGFNVYPLRQSAALWFDSGLEVRTSDERFTLAAVQMHHRMESRAPARFATLEEFKKDPNFAWQEMPAARERAAAVPELVPGPRRNGAKTNDEDRRLLPLTMYEAWPYKEHKWAMLIDLGTCTGCSACVVACQSENNIPVVGKTEVTRGREMHWLRIDRYFTGPPENPQTHFQPVPCMHCQDAPCEVVCPVNATVHSHDGLNDMVYNRCVGTRYCSNNCPYKVRRFNFLQYADYATGSLKLMHNPQVTVRSRGVMEKCTYCVQRIRGAEIEAERRTVDALEELRRRARGTTPEQEARIKAENRIRDGEVMTACQQACPAQAIVFGDLNDRRSQVTRGKHEPHEYALLAELNTMPRTTYLAQIKNPNPEVS